MACLERGGEPSSGVDACIRFLTPVPMFDTLLYYSYSSLSRVCDSLRASLRISWTELRRRPDWLLVGLFLRIEPFVDEDRMRAPFLLTFSPVTFARRLSSASTSVSCNWSWFYFLTTWSSSL